MDESGVAFFLTERTRNLEFRVGEEKIIVILTVAEAGVKTTRALALGKKNELIQALARYHGIPVCRRCRAERLTRTAPWRRAPVGRITIDLIGYEKWVESG